MSVKLCAITTIRKTIMQMPIPSKKTNVSLGKLRASNY